MTCEPVKALVWEPKHPDATLDYAVDFERACAREWSPWTDFILGQCIRVFYAGHPSGYEFRVSTAGRSGGRPPVWKESGTVRDGSVVWTPQTISSGSLLRTIVGTPTWDGPSGITISDELISGLRAIAKIAAGSDGEDYSITVTATGSDGLVIPVEVILPVRLPVRVC